MSTRRRHILIAALAPTIASAPTLVLAGKPPAIPVEVANELPGASLRGQGRLNVLLMHVYDIRLWSPMPFTPEAFTRVPLALEIEYARRLVGRLIAERSIEEMHRQQPLADTQRDRWLALMRQAFPDVDAGDRITGVQRPGEAARFFVNGAYRAEIRGAEFTRLFFGIWLAPQSSQPRLREQLLGLSS
jgi:Chalcone isomerase-like